MEPRQQPTWIRITLNLCAFLGVVATFFGWVQPAIGICVVVAAIVYLLWEFAPQIGGLVRRRLWVSLLIFVFVGAAFGAIMWAVWRRTVSKDPKQVAPSSQSAPQQSASDRQASPTQQLVAEEAEHSAAIRVPTIDNGLSPFVQVRIYNDGILRITNKGKVPISDISLDLSSQTVDMPHPPISAEEIAIPKVNGSSYFSSAITVRSEALNPGELAQIDLKKFLEFNALPETPEDMKATTTKKLIDTFSTFFVVRLTFRHVGTGEKYACFKIHGSYLKYPSSVDDNAAFAGSPSMMQFNNKLIEAIFAAARERYRDDAKEIRCEN